MSDPAARLGKEVLQKLCVLTRTSRDLLRYGVGKEHLDAWLKGGPVGFVENARKWNADPRLLAFAYLTAADLAACGKQNKAADGWLNRAQRAYAEADDIAGIALCRMFQGDRLCAPFSTPEVWNHAIREGASGGSELDQSLELAEFSRSEIHSELARAAYGEAEQAFGRAGAIRGMAAVQLRYGYLAMLDGNYDRAAEHALAAEARFEITGDYLGVNLARAHHALSRVGGGHLPEDTATALSIGEWGRNRGSFGYALGLGLLCAREARRWLLTAGEYERALACFRLAEALFDALGAPYNTAGVLMDQAAVFGNLGEVAAALERCERASDLQRHVLEKKPAHAQSIWLQAVSAGGVIFRLYMSQKDPEGMDRTASRLRELLPLSQVPVPTDPNASLRASQQLGEAVSIEAMKARNVDFQAAIAGVEIQRTMQQAQVLIPDYRGLRAKEAGDREGAQKAFEEALRHADQVLNLDTAFLKVSVLAHQERWNDAVELYRQYVDATMQSVARGLESSPVRAADSLFSRIRWQTHEQAFMAFTKLKVYNEALSHLNSLEQLVGENWWQNEKHPWEPLVYKGEIHEGLNQWGQAQDYYNQAIAIFEERRGRLTRDELKTAFAAVKSVQSVYFQAARTATQKYQTSLAAGDPAAVEEHFGRVLEVRRTGQGSGPARPCRG